MTESITVLGSINTDLVIKTPTLPTQGTTVLGGEFYRASGGKGANQAVAAARLARQSVRFVSAVGDDQFGVEAREGLERENLDLEHIKVVEGVASGVALIMVDGQGENQIAVASGANLELTRKDVSRADSAFVEGGVFLACLESPWEAVLAGLRKAKAAGMTTILNPAPANRCIMREDYLELVDILTPNQSEAIELADAGQSRLKGLLRSADLFQELGCQRIVITRGADGLLIVDGDEATSVESHVVEAVDTTAAGDAFNGALAVALAEGKPLFESCRWASAAAALSVTRLGAQPSLANREELEGFLNDQAPMTKHQ
ncbi:MAG: ribokinase [Planctomycetaceae bacterium]|nr:ribokinase [Planctomycetaceae bacterium]